MKTVATLEELELELFLRRREHSEIIWKTKNGDEIPIRNMSDTHLENTIKMIKRNDENNERDMEALGSIGDEDFF